MLMVGVPKSSRRTRRGCDSKSARIDRVKLDEMFGAAKVCHVGYILDGAPIVTPTFSWLDGDHVYLFAPSTKWFPQNASFGLDVCLSIPAGDGMSRARPALDGPANYRAATLFGRAQVVSSTQAKLALLHTILERSFSNRGEALLSASVKEMKATTILSLKIDDASLTVRTGHDAGVDGIFAAMLAERPDTDLGRPSKAKPLHIDRRARPPVNKNCCPGTRPTGVLSVRLPVDG